jgi:deazaflavin-dependent oxidoreductase (nitroreductase family)
MPLSGRMARFNRRATNRVTGMVAGWLPGFAVVVHRGRRSGREYRTPVNAFRTQDGYRIALTYGAESDWVRNVLAAGECELTVRRRRVRVVEPRLGAAAARRWAPPVVRQVLGAVGAEEYLDLKTAAGAGHEGGRAVG